MNTNQITVCHANGFLADSIDRQNKNLFSSQSSKPSYQGIETKKYLNDLIITFLRYNKEMVLLKSLYKEDYFRSLDYATNFYYRAGELPTDDSSSFVGSAIIVGFLKNDTWSFWMQSFMNVGHNSLNVPKNKLAPNFKQIILEKFY